MNSARTPRTIAELPFFTAGRFLKPDLVGRCAGERIEAFSGRELADRVRDLSLGLVTLGVSRGEHVALLSESRPEWLIADFAILAAGAITVPVYPTLSAEQVAFILADSRARLVIVSSVEQLEKVRSVTHQLPSLRGAVLIDATEDVGMQQLPVSTLATVAAAGHRRIQDGWGVAREFLDQVTAIRPDDLATIIYTSGTTAAPKGVMLTHANLAANVAGVLDVLDLTDDDTALSFLPLCHAFERTVAYVCLASGVSLIFAESIDTIARDLQRVRPTVMSAVPRVFEKLQARVLAKGQLTTGVRRKVFDWSIGVAARKGADLAEGRPSSIVRQAAWRLADRQVFSRIRDGIGGRLRWAVSGSAPLNPELGRFFLGIGLPILEGYGLTETSPVLTVTPPGGIRLGTVGPALPNVELRVAADGEVLARGPNVMRGYFERPDDTAAVVVDGWFHTGDIGSLDEKQYLRITDRKRELILTSGGKKIAPQPIEERLRVSPLVSEAMLVGDRRHFPAALILPDFAVLSARLGIAEAVLRGRVDAADVRAPYDLLLEEVNRGLAQFERVKKFVLLPEGFSVAGGELTPTLKIKRRVVVEKYRAVIDAIYS